ncbi:Periplasmic pH-dependent serine endoprotease DegQ precursor [Stieleria neptunia]|uniref:Periplasmic pH-dependent serine endoprotease DegQ n=1 Tax=Stieleria neptunia TaxID=2527979 RepID=A0A518HQA6_9BACT|nr:Trx7/PDZ domain-containing (seleno)protein [Stieleria neptunia]QDV43033.1 Periplasmic pH-dependent serine endoprotease DegQ precursor [Stieleria neptunia]
MRAVSSLILLFALGTVLTAQTREEIVRGDKEKVEREGFWIYNDIPGAFEEAKRTGKPIVVVLRCLPCHECVKLDDELVDTDPVIRPLLEQFVCVRQVATNGLDLDLFQYDTDQSFAVFFLAADKTIYGRFGTRSHRTEWMGDVSLKGLAKALQGALDLHADRAKVKDALAGKRGRPMEVSSPERYPSLKDKFTDSLNYDGDVVKSCIHCHQIGDAQREYYWHDSKPIPDKVLWPYPHPKTVGLIMDPNEMATVKEVTPDSVASRAGLRSGDVITTLDGQPMLSIADIQWVLHNVDPAGGAVPVEIKRDGAAVAAQLRFPKDWRHASDLSWRVTTWGLRRIAAGGMVLEPSTHSDAERRGGGNGSMALHVERVGKYGPHGTAKRTGFREGDVITSFDGRTDLSSEQDLLTYVVTSKRAGDRVDVTVQRGGKELTLTLPIQK